MLKLLRNLCFSRVEEKSTVSIFLDVQARSLRTSAVARVSDPWLDPLGGDVGGGGKIVRTVFERRRGPSSADSQPDDHPDTDQDQSHRTFDPKSRSLSLVHGRVSCETRECINFPIFDYLYLSRRSR